MATDIMEAKRRRRGSSLTIYGEVSNALDVLDGFVVQPPEFARHLNDLADRLRRA